MSSEIQLLSQINSKIVRSKKTDYDELQHVCISSHNDTTNQFKSLKIDDLDNLKVTDFGNERTTSLTVGPTTLFLSYESPEIPILKNKPIYIFVEAPDNANDINHIDLDVSVSNFTDYYELDSHYVTSHKNDRTLQVVVDFVARNIKVTLTNNKGSNITNVALNVSQ